MTPAPLAPADEVRTFILRDLVRDTDMDLSADEPLFSSGLLDSFAVTPLMLYLEDRFEIRIPPGPTIPRAVLRALRDAPQAAYAFHSALGVETVRADTLAERILAAAHGLRSRGLRPRQVIPIFGPSSGALWAAFVGAMAADLVP